MSCRKVCRTLFACGVLLCAATVMAQSPNSIFDLSPGAGPGPWAGPSPTISGGVYTWPADSIQCSYGPCDYWNMLNGTGNNSSTGAVGANSQAGHSSVRTFVSGIATTNNFTGGGSKDPNDLNNWAYTSTNTPNKDTLNSGFAAAYSLSDFDVVFGADRASPNGDANIGIWFFQTPVCLSNGAFVNCSTGAPAHHQYKDVFIISAFTGGGGTSTISAYIWNTNCASGVKNPTPGPLPGSCAASNLQIIESASSVCGSSDECAVTNTNTIGASWASYSGGALVSPLYFAGGLDITHAFAGLPGGLPCFSSFLEETRSSQSPTSVLKDFLLGSFPVCGMNITKACGVAAVSSDGTTINYPVNGTVTNTGVGALFNVAVKDCVGGSFNSSGVCSGTLDTVAVTNNTVGSPNNGTATLGAGETGAWNDTSSSTASSQSDQAFSLAATTSGGTLSVQSSNTASAACSLAVNSTLTVTKSCSTTLQQAANGTTVNVVVSYGGQVCNTGTSKVTGVTLTDYPDSIANTSISNGSVVASGITLNPAGTAGACYTYSPTGNPPVSLSYVPSAIDETISGGTGNGRYFFDDLITISSATATIGTLTQFENSNPTPPAGSNLVYNPDARINATFGFGTARCPICQGQGTNGECAP